MEEENFETVTQIRAFEEANQDSERLITDEDTEEEEDDDEDHIPMPFTWTNDKINHTHDEEETEIMFNFNNNATKNTDSEIQDELHTPITSEAPRQEVEQSAPVTDNTPIMTRSRGPVKDIPLPKNIIERKTYTRRQNSKREK